MSTYLRRCVQRAEERGATLVEMLVAISLTTIVIAIATTGMISASRVMGVNSLRLRELSTNKVAIEAMAKTLRTAVEPRDYGDAAAAGTAVISGDATSVNFYAALSSVGSASCTGTTHYGPSQVSYTLVGGVITETTRAPDLHACGTLTFTYACTPSSADCIYHSRVLARNIVSTSLFTYLASDGSALSVPLLSTRLEAVDSIDIVVVSRVAGAKSTTTATRVSMLNPGLPVTPSASTT